MIIFWISAVPSPISSIGTSRYRRSISNSLFGRENSQGCDARRSLTHCDSYRLPGMLLLAG